MSGGGVLAIVQARMGSSRLPGKVMRAVCGKPLIGHMLDRLAYCRRVDKVILATSVDVANDPLAAYVNSRGTAVFRGSESNVLERFCLAARLDQPKAVVRLSGDCALIDAAIVDRVVDAFAQENVDYASTDSSFAEGLDVEVISYDALEATHSEATWKSELEHVTQYVRKRANQFRQLFVPNDTDDSNIRIVVDEPEDFIVVEKIMEHFESTRPGLYYAFPEVKEFLLRHPDIMAINSSIVRNEGLAKSLAGDEEVR